MSKNLVQIGCNVGDEYIFDLITKEKINFCLFIDVNNDALVECKNIHFKKMKKIFESYGSTWEVELNYINCAISDMNLKEVNVNIPIDDNLSGNISIFHKLPDGKNAKKGFKSVKVPNSSINSIFDYYKLDTIDYLFIDAEGCDKGIVTNLFDWNKYFIKNIQFEFTHWDGYNLYISNHLNSTIFKMLMQGYKIHQSSATDIFASKILDWKKNPPRYARPKNSDGSWL